jgi:hypothetical protein
MYSSPKSPKNRDELIEQLKKKVKAYENRLLLKIFQRKFEREAADSDHQRSRRNRDCCCTPRERRYLSVISSE